jgi:O-methyltransferase
MVISDATETRTLYLFLLKQVLKNLPYLENEWNPIQPRGRLRRHVLAAYRRLGIQLCHARRSTLEDRIQGTDHTSVAHTMVSMARLDSLQACVERVILEDVPGDLIETGVLRGGCSILMRAVLKSYGVTDRCVWLADSFEGLPPPDPGKYPADAGATWHMFSGGDASEQHVRRNLERYGLLDDQVTIKSAWSRAGSETRSRGSPSNGWRS